MKRNRLIKATAWINVAIIILACYTIRNIPENALFAGFAYMFSSLWLTAYAVANNMEKRPPVAATTDSPDAPKNANNHLHDNTKEATAQ